MSVSEIIGISKILKLSGLFNSIKELVNLLSDNPHKHPLVYVFIVTIALGFFYPDNFDLKYFIFYEILIFLISIVFFYCCFYSFYPWIKMMIRNFFAKKEAMKYFYELTNEQKYYLLEEFFPNPHAERTIVLHHYDHCLRELIECKILICDNYSFDDECITTYHVVGVKIAKCILEIIRKDNLLKVWKAEKEASEIKIKESESELHW